MSEASSESVSGRLLACSAQYIAIVSSSGLRGVGFVVVAPGLRGAVAAPPGLKRTAGGERASYNLSLGIPPTMLEWCLSSEYA